VSKLLCCCCRAWRIDADRSGLGRMLGARADEAFRVAGIGLVEHVLSLLDDLFGPAVMQRIGCQKCDSAVMVLVVVPAEKLWQKARASSMEPKRSGNSGRYLKVLNWLSEYGLSLEV
jgi:hypothetical protein